MPYITILNEFTSKFKMHIYVPSVFFHKHIDIRVLLWLTKSQKPDWFIAGSEGCSKVKKYVARGMIVI